MSLQFKRIGVLSKLNPPVISQSGGDLTVYIPAGNGSFGTHLELYADDELFDTIENTSYVYLANYVGVVFETGVYYDITVKCVGTNFIRSDASNVEVYRGE